MPRERCGGGFTLIEVMIVLAILSLMAAIAVPLLSRRAPAATVAAAAVELRAALDTARAAAIAEDRAIVFAAAADGYRIDGRPYRVASNVAIAIAGGRRIEFYPSGGSSGGRVILTSGASRREIAIGALTGRAAIFP